MPFKYNALLGLGLDNTIPLDGAGKIPATYLPSYVDDVEEYNNLAAFPATGETGKIYVAIDTGFVYRWSGSVYVQIGVTAAAGSTTQVQFNDGGAFGGDAGLVFDKTTDALTIAGPVIHPLGAAATPSLTFTGDTNTGIYSPGADQLAISTNGTGRLFVDSAGNVGVGTNIAYALGSFAATGSMGLFPSTVNTVGSFVSFTSGLGSASTETIFKHEITNFSNSSNYGTALSFLTRTSTAAVERMRLTSAGLLGLGTSAPSQALHVVSSVNQALFEGATQGNITIQKAGTAGMSLYSNAAGTLAFYDNAGAAERARIDSSGRLLVGTSTAPDYFGGSAGLSVAGTGNSSFIAAARYNSASAFGADLSLLRSRNGTVGSHTVVQNNDVLGSISFLGSDGSTFISGARIFGEVDGTPGANDMPGRLIFSTTSDGAASPTERLRITSAGVLQVADAGNITVGTTTGTKIGTATTQKLGFYNKTPVVQPIAVADATDAASAITQLNALLARMRDLGLIAT
jgi:hypothetical protein